MRKGLELWVMKIVEHHNYGFIIILVEVLKTNVLREMCKTYVHEVPEENKKSH